jgi:NtrC-family two-component system sensor histidine kinase KinB
MLSIFQRLLLGGLLLFALVTGLSFLVRGSFVALSTLDGEQKRMDGATAAVAAAQGSVASAARCADTRPALACGQARARPA